MSRRNQREIDRLVSDLNLDNQKRGSSRSATRLMATTAATNDPPTQPARLTSRQDVIRSRSRQSNNGESNSGLASRRQSLYSQWNQSAIQEESSSRRHRQASVREEETRRSTRSRSAHRMQSAPPTHTPTRRLSQSRVESQNVRPRTRSRRTMVATAGTGSEFQLNPTQSSSELSLRRSNRLSRVNVLENSHSRRDVREDETQRSRSRGVHEIRNGPSSTRRSSQARVANHNSRRDSRSSHTVVATAGTGSEFQLNPTQSSSELSLRRSDRLSRVSENGSSRRLRSDRNESAPPTSRTPRRRSSRESVGSSRSSRSLRSRSSTIQRQPPRNLSDDLVRFIENNRYGKMETFHLLAPDNDSFQRYQFIELSEVDRMDVVRPHDDTLFTIMLSIIGQADHRIGIFPIPFADRLIRSVRRQHLNVEEFLFTRFDRCYYYVVPFKSMNVLKAVIIQMASTRNVYIYEAGVINRDDVELRAIRRIVRGFVDEDENVGEFIFLRESHFPSPIEANMDYVFLILLVFGLSMEGADYLAPEEKSVEERELRLKLGDLLTSLYDDELLRSLDE